MAHGAHFPGGTNNEHGSLQPVVHDGWYVSG